MNKDSKMLAEAYNQVVSQYNEVNTQIAELLKQGKKVVSHVAGRMGQIVAADSKNVTVKTPRGEGVTSFNVGDPVKFDIRENEVHIFNKEI